MGRILAIDYGLKRVGLAVTDPVKIIAGPLETVRTHEIEQYLKAYLEKEPVELFVLGLPKSLSGGETDLTQPAQQFANRLRKLFPDKEVVFVDERFTSKMAFSTMIEGGLRKKARRDKSMVDKISATIILQSYLAQSER